MSKSPGQHLIRIDFETHTIIGDVFSLNDSAVNTTKRKLYFAPNASHFVFTDLRANDPKEFDHVFDQICNMLKDIHPSN